jgi:hypothetical protein
MNRTIVGSIVFAVVVFCCSDDLSGQWHHRYFHHQVVPYCGEDVIVLDRFFPGPIVEPFWWTPSPIWFSQPINVVPRAPAFIAPPPAAAMPIDEGENFARKDRIAVDRPLDLAGGERTNSFSDPDEIRRRASVLKVSSPAGRARADRLISSGDHAFAEQNLARATARYRDAIAKAPDYAEAHFRLAHAYVATRRYNLALKSALVALELAGTSRRDGFSLEDMYQGDQFPREQHLKRLVDASLREPADGGLQFLIGFTLHFDAQHDLAQGYFQAAQALAGIQRSYVRYFLPVKPVAEPAEAAN